MFAALASTRRALAPAAAACAAGAAAPPAGGPGPRRAPAAADGGGAAAAAREGPRRGRGADAGCSSSLIRDTSFIYSVRAGGRFEDTWAVERELGSGAFGTVLLARHRALGYLRAAKRIRRKPQDREQTALLLNEIHSLMDLDHPHVVKLLRYLDEGSELYLFFELCEGPSLFERINDAWASGGLSEADAAVAMCQMMRALKCCHAHYIGHFDIKPENFMYTRPDKVHLKLIDLGLSSSFKRDSSEVRGSVPYMAPEVWDGTCGPEADIWSCGVVLFEMLTGTNFLGDPGALGDSEARRRVRDRAWVRQRLREARECRELSPEAQDFLSLLLRHDRHRRPTAREALGHPFLASTDPLGLYPPEVVRRAEECLEDFPRACREFTAEPVLVRGVLLAVAHFSAYCFPQTRPQRLAFALADAGSDGELSIEALESYYLRTAGSVPDGLEGAFREVDLNDDGYISYTEFLSATLPSSVRRDEALLHEIFREMDRNHDGYLDVQDLADLFCSGSDERCSCRAALLEVLGPRAASCEPRLGWPEFLELVQGSPPRQ